MLKASALPAAHAMSAGGQASKTPEMKIDARWIWYPEHRTIPCTFVFFRKTFELSSIPRHVQAWVSGHSRYKLWINGEFVQRGPAPCDPRYWEVDPVEVQKRLRTGKNVVSAIVCAFGGGDGTYVPSAPIGSGEGQGFLFQAKGEGLNLLTDGSWKTLRPRCWKAGNYQRWFLRALQEEFDAREWPEDWEQVEYEDAAWKPAMVSQVAPGRPNLGEVPREGWHEDWVLHPRTIPPIRESVTPAAQLVNSGWVEWNVPPEEYFECFPADAFVEKEDRGVARRAGAGVFPVAVAAPGKRSHLATFDFGREVVGHPYVRMKAPAGTVVEILFLEKQEPGKLLLRTRAKFGQWLRLTAREGVTEFEAFEYDAMRLMQIAVRNATGPVELLEVGVKERSYAYPRECDLTTSDAEVNSALAASVATQKIVSQETLVDNVTRERQQYGGDLDQAKLASYYAFGEYAQPARMIRTFAQGQNPEGWFADCWPAWDRMQRLFQKHLQLTTWGPIVDHGLQFGIAGADHYLFTGDKELLAYQYPKMLKYERFLESNAQSDGLIPIFGWKWNTVWLDHIGYLSELDKHAGLNIYWAGYQTHAIAKMADWLGERAVAAEMRQRAKETVAKVRTAYWSDERGYFVDNLPRLNRDGETRVHTRTLSMALLFGATPPGKEMPSVDLLELPVTSNASVHEKEGGKLKVGSNYPLNDIWRLWALGRFGRGAVVVKDLRERWAKMVTVRENGTYGEMWNPRPSSSGDVWCQSNPVPLIAAYQELLGVRPTAPGFAEYEVRPQVGGLSSIEATIATVRGDLRLRVAGEARGFRLQWTAPARAEGRLVVPETARVRGLPPGVRFEPGNYAATRQVRLPAVQEVKSWDLSVDLP